MQWLHTLGKLLIVIHIGGLFGSGVDLIAASLLSQESSQEEKKTEEAPADSEPETSRSETDSSMGAAGQRNENVPLYQLDTNEQKELNKRIGTTPQVIDETEIEASYFAAELGKPSVAPLIFDPQDKADRWHGELFHSHQNSALNARAFFQVGPVQPSRQNSYGFTVTGPMDWLGTLTGGFEQEKIRGMVNGNVLVPLESERTPLAEDPKVRELVARFLGAYPEELPNRLDFNPRALNTNSPQRIDGTSAHLRLDRPTGPSGKFYASYQLDRQRVDSFQLVAGQNPNTEIHGHMARLAQVWDLSPHERLAISARFQRTKSVLQSEPNAVGPRVEVGHQIQELGPDSEFPVDRSLNTFTWGGEYSRIFSGGLHALKLGGHLTRVQLNSFESNDTRGTFRFSNQFGRSAIDNLRFGTPSRYVVTVGDIYRGYRNWRGSLFLGDEWRISPPFHLTVGLRYEFEGKPTEIFDRETIPYGCDCNNFAPRLAIAYRMTGETVLRTSYMISYGEIYPVTYQQIRNNPPLVRQYQVQNADLLDPLNGIDVEDSTARYSPTFISPNLTTPYSHQYNFSLEHRFSNQLQLRLGYVGSRTFQLFKTYVLNRAEIVPGIPQVPSTIDQRRPDPRYFEIYSITNGGVAYLDAAQIEVNLPYRQGLSLTATYTFSKAIDTGNDYTSVAANKEVTRGRDQWQYLSVEDKKGLSNFDSPHSLLIFGAYQLPDLPSGSSFAGAIFNHWTVTATALAKRGTPYTLYVGSDAPGFGNVDGSGSDRPNILDPSILGSSFSDPDTAPLVMSRDRFAYISPGEIRGNVGRNTFRKGVIKNLNMALNKGWRISSNDDISIQFRLEAYNLTNSPQFDEPGRNLSSPAFGQITNTLNNGRIFQANLRLAF